MATQRSAQLDVSLSVPPRRFRRIDNIAIFSVRRCLPLGNAGQTGGSGQSETVALQAIDLVLRD